MGFWSAFLTGGLVILLYMVLLWVVSLALKNSSIVDIFWGAGFVLAVWLYHGLTPEGLVARKWLISLIVTVWGLRLSGHILWRNWGKPEDFRYAKWRRETGHSWWWRSFFKVFLLQGALMWIISTPLLGAQTQAPRSHLIWLDFAGMVVWAVGFFFEAMGDLQLARFKADPANKGQVLDRGVWRYTRHPNYFGDATQWWGFYLIALAAGAWWTIFAPLIMTGLLLKVSGVALLEKTLKETKPQYADYIARTSAFFPLPPKRRS
ncbi:MAG: DUF1295 domain-containing protein [Anaerolineae bacterium]|jgi:steroid 5-alpha reductase family enzyme